jgi:hypothetical protein
MGAPAMLLVATAAPTWRKRGAHPFHGSRGPLTRLDLVRAVVVGGLPLAVALHRGQLAVTRQTETPGGVRLSLGGNSTLACEERCVLSWEALRTTSAQLDGAQ